MTRTPSAPEADRTFPSAPTSDSERAKVFQGIGEWSPSRLNIFGHSISVDVATGNLQLSATDLAYPYYKLPFQVGRSYDAQEQYMQRLYLRNYPNVNPKPHWLGNWQINWEASVDELWLETFAELSIGCNLGVGGLFREQGAVFRRDLRDRKKLQDFLRTYGIPDRTLTDLEWHHSPGDFLLRTLRGRFLVVTGRHAKETLVDPETTRLWVFSPSTGLGVQLDSQYAYNVVGSAARELGPPCVVSKITDALGHSITLTPDGSAPPFRSFKLTDDSGRHFELRMEQPLNFHDGLEHPKLSRRRLMTALVDETRTRNNQTTYSYLDEGLLEKVARQSDLGVHEVQYRYGQGELEGILEAVVDNHGHEVRFEYVLDPTDLDARLNPRLKIRRITDPEGVTLEYKYDHTNSHTWVTVAQNGVIDREVDYQYIRDQDDTKQRFITEESTNVRRGFLFTKDSRVVRRPADKPQVVTHVATYSTDGRFNLVSATDPQGRTTSFGYNDFNQVKMIRDPRGHWTRYLYDNPDEHVPPTRPSPANPCRYDLIRETQLVLLRTYNPRDPHKLELQESERLREFEWNRYDAQSSVSRHDRHLSTHRPSKLNIAGSTWIQAYDDAANNRPLRPTLVRSPLGLSTKRTFGVVGECLSHEDPSGNQWTYNYNVQGLLESIRDPNQAVTKIRYDRDTMSVREVVDPLGKATTLVRDLDGSLNAIVDAVGDRVDFCRYRNGRIKTVVEHRPAIPRDPTDASSDSIMTPFADLNYQLSYTPLGVVQTIENPKGLALKQYFDEVGRRYQWASGESSQAATKYVFNEAGDILVRQDRVGKITSYVYARESGDLLEVHLPQWRCGSKSVKGSVIRYRQRDYQGRVLSLSNSDFSDPKEFAYDENGKLLISRDHTGFEVHYDYDADNRLFRLHDNTGELHVTYALDALGRAERVTDSTWLDGAFSWDFDFDSRVNGQKKVLNLYRVLQKETGLLASFDYDEKGRREGVTYHWSRSRSPIFEQSLRYRDDDFVGAIVGENANEYTLDGTKQVVFETAGALTSDYDEAGNQLFRAKKTGRQRPPRRSYDDQNRLLRDNANFGVFGYDANGNLTKAQPGQRRFYYDGLDRLRCVVKPNHYRVEYKYDELGQLVERRLTRGASRKAETTTFNHLNGRPLRIIAGGSTTVLATWSPMGNLLRLRKPRFDFGGRFGHSLLPIHSAAGDVRRLLTANKREVASVNYDTWGAVQSESDTDHHLEFFGYRQGFRDKATGLTLFGARWYSAELRRWVNEDPLIEMPQVAQYRSLANRYVYAGNSPVSLFDPTGFNEEWNREAAHSERLFSMYVRAHRAAAEAEKEWREAQKRHKAGGKTVSEEEVSARRDWFRELYRKEIRARATWEKYNANIHEDGPFQIEGPDRDLAGDLIVRLGATVIAVYATPILPAILAAAFGSWETARLIDSYQP